MTPCHCSAGGVGLLLIQMAKALGATVVTTVSTSAKAELAHGAGAVFADIVAGRLEIRIGATYPLADAARAKDELASRRTTGKLLLIP